MDKKMKKQIEHNGYEAEIEVQLFSIVERRPNGTMYHVIQARCNALKYASEVQVDSKDDLHLAVKKEEERLINSMNRIKDQDSTEIAILKELGFSESK